MRFRKIRNLLAVVLILVGVGVIAYFGVRMVALHRLHSINGQTARYVDPLADRWAWTLGAASLLGGLALAAGAGRKR